MPETIREKVVAAFCTKVGADRCVKLDGSSELPAKSVWDNREELTKTAYGKMSATLPLPVEYLASVDSVTHATHSHQANAMLGEIIQSATSGDNTLGGLCRSIQYTESEIVYPEDGSQEIEVYAVFNVVYEFAVGDPFTA